MVPYIGGKYRQAKWINSYIPKNIDIYIEIFGGAMWVYINSDLSAKTIYYNDYNPYMANLWKCFKDYNRLLKLLENSKYKLNDKKIFWSLRNKYSKIIEFTQPDFDIAYDYIYILTHCFSGDIGSGGMKLSSNGIVPLINKLKNKKYINKINNIEEILNLSYEEVIDRFDSPNTFFYIDPPYWQTENYYASHNFTKNSHFDLSERLNKCKAKWILSYYMYPELEKMYPKNKYTYEKREYTKSSIKIKKHMKQKKATEILISNYGKKKKEIFFKEN